jgi:arsenate reductase-like glutaredoxin family protein
MKREREEDEEEDGCPLHKEQKMTANYSILPLEVMVKIFEYSSTIDFIYHLVLNKMINFMLTPILESRCKKSRTIVAAIECGNVAIAMKAIMKREISFSLISKIFHILDVDNVIRVLDKYYPTLSETDKAHVDNVYIHESNKQLIMHMKLYHGYKHPLPDLVGKHKLKDHMWFVRNVFTEEQNQILLREYTVRYSLGAIVELYFVYGIGAEYAVNNIAVVSRVVNETTPRKRARLLHILQSPYIRRLNSDDTYTFIHKHLYSIDDMELFLDYEYLTIDVEIIIYCMSRSNMYFTLELFAKRNLIDFKKLSYVSDSWLLEYYRKSPSDYLPLLHSESMVWDERQVEQCLKYLMESRKITTTRAKTFMTLCPQSIIQETPTAKFINGK